MKITSIEPTPSPHSMKINLDEKLPDGETRDYKLKEDNSNSPGYVQKLFAIEGVKGLYHVIDFIALERHPKSAWEDILPQVREVLGSAEEKPVDLTAQKTEPDDAFGEVKVFIQEFRGIPMQVKLQDGDEEKRFGLPERFADAAMQASTASENMLFERKWVEQSPRYGDMQEMGSDVAEEIDASYDPDRLKELVNQAISGSPAPESLSTKKRDRVTVEMLDSPEWKERYAALDRIIEPTLEDLPVLDKALDDSKASVRRLSTAFLGMIEEPEVLPYLYKALKDKAINVRRTAGDCISDLGFKEAMPEMIRTLDDPSRLVRWRAAMFLYETGDETAIPALTNAADDPEFEVRMQVKMALARIEGGEEAQGSIWAQMTEAAKQK
ncbi:conserved virulence factor C family protein [Lentibacillus sediminis]|uniref:conserved virulence factor C family protein n=1 Tax=Lentibacillus sediminis TaxID=1940529 RepID=UPI000C1B8C2A|nr:conserved virulence factor C family protein [Lentibacillus sediminis]